MVEVAAAVIVKHGHVLACQRRADQRHPGKWEFPGGKREAGETIAMCLKRELEEELGIDAEIGEQVWHMSHEYSPAAAVELFFHRVERFTGAIQNRLFADVRWVPVGRLSALDFLEADRELVRQIDSGAIGLADA